MDAERGRRPPLPAVLPGMSAQKCSNALRDTVLQFRGRAFGSGTTAGRRGHAPPSTFPTATISL